MLGMGGIPISRLFVDIGANVAQQGFRLAAVEIGKIDQSVAKPKHLQIISTFVKDGIEQATRGAAQVDTSFKKTQIGVRNSLAGIDKNTKETGAIVSKYLTGIRGELAKTDESYVVLGRAAMAAKDSIVRAEQEKAVAVAKYEKEQQDLFDKTALVQQEALAKQEASQKKFRDSAKKGFNDFANIGKYTSLGILGIAGASVFAGASFQKQMELVVTQAGYGQKEVDKLKQKVLDLAPAVGVGPTALAKGLFHIASSGFAPAKAMDILKIAAEGARVGNANMEDTTNALLAVMKTAPKDIKGASDAMGVMNEIVGHGNLRMEDLTKAFTSGILPAAKALGLGMKDVGAALDVMTARGVPAESAATRLRTVLSLIANETPKAKKALAELGISQGQLAGDMREHGLIYALQDLQSHAEKTLGTGKALSKEQINKDVAEYDKQLVAAGLRTTALQKADDQYRQQLERHGSSATKLAQIYSDAFGGARSGTTFSILVQNSSDLQKIRGSLQDSSKATKDFNTAWKETGKTFAEQLAQAWAGIQKLAVILGDWLIPKLEATVKWLIHAADWLGKHKVLAEALGVTIGGFLLASVVAFFVRMGQHTAKGIRDMGNFAKSLWKIGTTAKEVTDPVVKALQTQGDAIQANTDLLSEQQVVLKENAALMRAQSENWLGSSAPGGKRIPAGMYSTIDPVTGKSYKPGQFASPGTVQEAEAAKTQFMTGAAPTRYGTMSPGINAFSKEEQQKWEEQHAIRGVRGPIWPGSPQNPEAIAVVEGGQSGLGSRAAPSTSIAGNASTVPQQATPSATTLAAKEQAAAPVIQKEIITQQVRTSTVPGAAPPASFISNTPGRGAGRSAGSTPHLASPVSPQMVPSVVPASSTHGHYVPPAVAAERAAQSAVAKEGPSISKAIGLETQLATDAALSSPSFLTGVKKTAEGAIGGAKEKFTTGLGKLMHGGMIAGIGIMGTQIAEGLVKGSAKKVVGDIGTFGSVGAGIGSMFGPTGMIIGAFTGGLIGALKALVGHAPTYGQQLANVFGNALKKTLPGDIVSAIQSQKVAAAFDKAHNEFVQKSNIVPKEAQIISGGGRAGRATPAEIAQIDRLQAGADKRAQAAIIPKELAAGQTAGNLLISTINKASPGGALDIGIITKAAETSLKTLPKVARDSAYSTIAAWIHTIQGHQLPMGSVDTFISQMHKRFSDLGKWTTEAAATNAQSFVKAYTDTKTIAAVQTLLSTTHGKVQAFYDNTHLTSQNFNTQVKKDLDRLNGLIEQGNKTHDKLLVKNATEAFKQLKQDSVTYQENMSTDGKGLGKAVAEGFIKGMLGNTDGAKKSATDFSKAVQSKLNDVWGVHSPSTWMANLAKELIDGLQMGLDNGHVEDVLHQYFTTRALNEFQSFSTSATKAQTNLWTAIATATKQGAATTLGYITSLSTNAISAMNLMQTSISSSMKTMASMVSTNTTNMDVGVADGLKLLQEELNKALKALGAKPIHFGISVPKKAGGGIPNPGGGSHDDHILFDPHGHAVAALSGSEGIVNRPQMGVIDMALSLSKAMGIMPYGNMRELWGSGMTHYAGGGPLQGFATGGSGLTYLKQGPRSLIGTGGVYVGPDQGLDFTNTGRRVPVYALGNGTVTRVMDSGSGWGRGNQGLLVYQLTSGPAKGRFVYTAEDFLPSSGLKVGSRIRQGQTIGVATGTGASPGIETGFAMNAAGQAYGNSMEGKDRPADPQSTAFARFIEGLPFASGGIGGDSTVMDIHKPKLGGSGVLHTVGQHALNHATKATRHYMNTKGVSDGSHGANSGKKVGESWKGNWVQVMAEIAKANHWSLADWKAVVNIESGGIPSILGVPTVKGSNAVGLSRAFGLGQFLGSTYTHYAKYGSESYDPVKQIEAMAQYISDRYGTPTSALTHEHGFGWYNKGGALRRFATGGSVPIPGAGSTPGSQGKSSSDISKTGRKPRNQHQRVANRVNPKMKLPGGTTVGALLSTKRPETPVTLTKAQKALAKLGALPGFTDANGNLLLDAADQAQLNADIQKSSDLDLLYQNDENYFTLVDGATLTTQDNQTLVNLRDEQFQLSLQEETLLGNVLNGTAATPGMEGLDPWDPRRLPQPHLGLKDIVALKTTARDAAVHESKNLVNKINTVKGKLAKEGDKLRKLQHAKAGKTLKVVSDLHRKLWVNAQQEMKVNAAIKKIRDKYGGIAFKLSSTYTSPKTGPAIEAIRNRYRQPILHAIHLSDRTRLQKAQQKEIDAVRSSATTTIEAHKHLHDQNVAQERKDLKPYNKLKTQLANDRKTMVHSYQVYRDQYGKKEWGAAWAIQEKERSLRKQLAALEVDNNRLSGSNTKAGSDFSSGGLIGQLNKDIRAVDSTIGSVTTAIAGQDQQSIQDALNEASLAQQSGLAIPPDVQNFLANAGLATPSGGTTIPTTPPDSGGGGGGGGDTAREVAQSILREIGTLDASTQQIFTQFGSNVVGASGLAALTALGGASGGGKYFGAAGAAVGFPAAIGGFARGGPLDGTGNRVDNYFYQTNHYGGGPSDPHIHAALSKLQFENQFG